MVSLCEIHLKKGNQVIITDLKIKFPVYTAYVHYDLKYYKVILPDGYITLSENCIGKFLKKIKENFRKIYVVAVLPSNKLIQKLLLNHELEFALLILPSRERSKYLYYVSEDIVKKVKANKTVVIESSDNIIKNLENTVVDIISKYF